MFETVKTWARKHKKGIIITCSFVAVVGTAFVLIINGKRITIPVEELVEDVLAEVPKTPSLPPIVETAEAVEKTAINTFPRSAFIRHLPAGQHASPTKVAQAAGMGIDLKPRETFVNACTVKMKVAA